MTPAISAICRATWAALPTSVWTRMYACTITSSYGQRTSAVLNCHGTAMVQTMFHPGRQFFLRIGMFCDARAPARTDARPLAQPCGLHAAPWLGGWRVVAWIASG